jgi:hypothetical protein
MRRKWIRLCLAVIATPSILAGRAFGFGGTGSGTEVDPYLITDVAQLQEMNDGLDAWYVLGSDIDASETDTWNGGAGFVPVGSGTDPFVGVLDGRGHTISGLYIHRVDGIHQGLFGVLAGAIVTNVHIVDADVTFNTHGGLLAAHANQGTIIRHCSATGAITLKPGSTDGRGGGLVGNVRTGSLVDRCWADVSVAASSRRQVGGLVGYLRGVEPGPVASIVNSYSWGTVSGTGSKQGNLLGDADGSFVGHCYSSGFGKALIGYNYRGPIITDCYWDSDKGASSSPYGGTPKTTAQMMHETTFVGWDFVEVWGIIEDETYPFLLPLLIPLNVAVDIKPQSCRNPLNLGSGGVLPVAVLGRDDFDIGTIDAASLRLAGVAPIRSGLEDVATPVIDANECECTEEGADGHMDLTLKFRTQEVVAEFAAWLNNIEAGEELVLTITGSLTDGTPIEGSDCVVLVGNVPRSLAAKLADLNDDGIVDLSDFARMVQYWLEPAY